MNEPTQIQVAYPGREGAHSAAACEQLLPSGAEPLALPSFRAVAEALSLIHISEPTRLLSISYAVFCLKKKK